LEFGRARLLELGGLKGVDTLSTINEDDGNIDESAESDVLKRTFKDWRRFGESSSNSSSDDIEVLDDSNGSGSDELENALSSSAKFNCYYLQLTESIALHYQVAGRERFAARILCERADIFIKLKSFENALDILLPLSDFYAESGWNPLSQWVLLRIAFCYNQTSNRTKYEASARSFRAVRTKTRSEANWLAKRGAKRRVS